MILVVKKEQQEALYYLYQRLKDDEKRIKDILDKKASFRHSADGRFNHTVAVLHHGREILTKVVCNKDVVEMAIILHDIAKLSDDVNHEKTGAVIAKEYLENRCYGQVYTRQVLECIRLHNRKGQTPNASIETKVVQDADLLDKRLFYEIYHLSAGRLWEEGRKTEYTKLLKTYKGNFKKHADRANFPFVRQQILGALNRIEREFCEEEIIIR
ncbi:HD domain-containing protein [Anaerosolibacter sp.]|uniref:HD domain-containing protein n=1 Tax=Anaerosolibacter sp. TaxID=1872527 RepID=UPI0039EFF0DE